jgi:hypothetical protein
MEDIWIIKGLLKKDVWQGYWKLFREFRGWRRHGKDLGRLWSGSSIYISYVHLVGARNIFYSAHRTWACMALFREPAPLFVQRTHALFSLPQSFKFFHSFSITSIFNRLHGVLNVGKKITNYTV